MTIFNQVKESVAALDESMPQLDDGRQDYGPEGCAERGVLLVLAGVALVVFGRKGGKR